MLRPQPPLTRQSAPTAFALRSIADRKARGRLRAAATAEAVGAELEWLDAEGWRYQLERPPAVTISPKDIERAAATVDLKVWDASDTLIFRDRIHAWDGFPVLVPDGTEHEEDDGLGGKVRVSNFRESPLEAARSDLAHTVRVVTKGGKSPWVKDKPGTVSTFYSGTSDNQIENSSGTYATAREGSGSWQTWSSSDTYNRVGQYTSGSYYVRQGFMEFDTSTLSGEAASAVALSLYSHSDTTYDFVIEARLLDWGASVGTEDFIAGSSLSSYTRVATYDTTSGFTAGSYYTFSEDGSNFQSGINTSGYTKLCLSSDKQRTGSAPSGVDRVAYYSADYTGTTQDPKLVVTHAATVTEVAGAPADIEFTGFAATQQAQFPAGAQADIQFEGTVSTFTMQVVAGAPADIQFTGFASTYSMFQIFAAGAPADITWQGFASTIATVDMVVEVLLSNLSGDTDEECGVVFRLGNATNFLAAYVDDGDNLVHLSAFEGGVERSIATAAWTPADTAEIRVIVQQDRIRVWLNHILLIDEIDSTYLTPVKAGLFGRSTTAVRYSAFLAQLLSEVP